MNEDNYREAHPMETTPNMTQATKLLEPFMEFCKQNMVQYVIGIKDSPADEAPLLYQATWLPGNSLGEELLECIRQARINLVEEQSR